ncbi:MAG: DUF1461 domain-containing protein, partial [Arthrobacter sp.]
MRDEAVASQDQDPTTEGVPEGQTPDGRGPGPSDASETIVSGKAAAGSREDVPAEHDAWDAEFAGLAGTPPETAGNTDDAVPAADSAASGKDHDDDAQDPEDQDGAAGPAAGAMRSRSAREVPGGHPSLAQRSTLPMRAASTMPDLSRYDTGDSSSGSAAAGSGNTEADSQPAAGATAGAAGTAAASAAFAAGSAAGTKAGAQAAGERDAAPETRAAGADAGQKDEAPGDAALRASGQNAEPHPTAAAGGPWYGPGTDQPGSEAAGTDRPEAEGQGADGARTESTGADNPETSALPEADPGISSAEAARRSAERERAATAKPVLGRVIQVAIAVFFPVMLLAAAIRAVATPLFLWVEYNRPGFPADSFGFSTEDRMTYGSYAVDYLLNFASPRYLGDLVTPDGDPLYLASEVSHMADVKAVLTVAFLTALGMALLSIAGGLYLARRSPGGIRRALFAGAVATLAIIAGLLVAAVLAWEEFFTMVHTIFFAQGNWTFRLDDTLIRLFPAQFWMDAGAAIAGIVLLVCILVMVFTWPTKKRR